jgi:TolB protein
MSDSNLPGISPFDDMAPRYSPQGNKVAFVSDRGLGTQVFWIPSLGGVAKPLANTYISGVERIADALGALGAMPWSPDETELLFSRLLPTGQLAIFKTDLSSRETQMTFPKPGSDDLSASWSFDGQWIVFQRRSGRSGLWLLPTRGGEPQALLTDDFDHGQPAWSEDGKRVAYTSNRATSWNIWEIEVSTQDVRPLTAGPGDQLYPTISRDGSIAYTQFSHQTDLYLKAVEGDTEPRRLTQWIGDNFAARINPQGGRREVVYHSNRSGDFEIWHRDLESGEEVNLSHRVGLDIFPDWSPDGERIVFVSDRDGAMRPWIKSRDGNLPQRLSDKVISLADPIYFLSPTRSPRWSGDGEAIAYVAQGDQGNSLWVFDLTNQQDPQPHLSHVLGFEWYGQGHRYVIYRCRSEGGEGAMQMVVADLETGAENLLLEASFCELAVAPDGTAVAYCDAVAHMTMNVYLLRLKPPGTPEELPSAVGDPTLLVAGDQGRSHIHMGGWSPDTKEIIYSLDEDFGHIWLLSKRQE